MRTKIRQHWIVYVYDSINEYDEVQTAYYDGTRIAAVRYFKSTKDCKRVARYFGNLRYHIVMRANAYVLQDVRGLD